MYILAEQNGLAFGFSQIGHRAGRMAGDVQGSDGAPAQRQRFLLPAQPAVHPAGVELGAIPTGCRDLVVALFQEIGIQFVNDHRTAQLLAQVASAAGVVVMAVGEQ